MQTDAADDLLTPSELPIDRPPDFFSISRSELIIKPALQKPARARASELRRKALLAGH